MYVLLETYFAGTDATRFERDLFEKQGVILLRSAAGRIEGFSTFMRMTAQLDGREIVAFFSGDTIVDRAYWGETALTRTWATAVLGEATRIVAERADMRAYWFLICSGYKTWRFLPVFFREFYPNADRPTPAYFQQLLDTLAGGKFGDQYIRGSGIVRFREATPLRPGIAEITAGRLRDRHVAFFAEANPGFADGDELACVTELSVANLTPAGRRMVNGA